MSITIYLLGENTEKYIIFTVPIERKATRINKNGEEITKKSFMLEGLWRAHYQILSIIFLKEFVKLNVNMATMIKHVKTAELNPDIVTVFLNTQTLKTV